MKIALVTQVFWPETIFINDLVDELHNQGHSLKVLTGKPNYPGGDVFDGYVADGIQEEFSHSNVRVFRIPIKPRKQGRAFQLLSNYFSYCWNGIRYFPSSVRGESYDVVLAMGLSPITSVIPAIFLKRRLKTPLVIWVQDLWPESAVATGFVKNKGLVYLIGLLVRAIYLSADLILVQSKAFVNPVGLYADRKKIRYYGNSCKELPSGGEEHLPSHLGGILQEYFCVTFAGNLGTAQALDTAVAAAKKYRHNDSFRLLLVGSGSALEGIKAELVKLKLTNVILPGRLAPECMPELFRKSQALLVSLTGAELFTHTVPSKVQAYLSAGRPILASLNGEGARIVVESGAGLASPAGDSGELAKNFDTIYQMSIQERRRMGEAGKVYFLKHFEVKKQAARLVKLLEQQFGITGDAG